MTRKFLVPIELPADPVAAMEAATKQYVDANAGGGGGGGIAPPALRTGLWYGPPGAGNISAVSRTAGNLAAFPWEFPTAAKIGEIGVNVGSAGAAGAVMRIGIWNEDAATGLPTTLRWETTTALDAVASGFKSEVIPGGHVLPAGRYWFGCATQVATCNLHCTAGFTRFGVGDANPAMAATNNPAGYQWNGITGALPNPLPTPTLTIATTIPRIVVKHIA